MATWDNASLLQYANDLTGRTGTDSITSVTKYRWLSIAQNQVVADIAAICPHVLYPTAATASLPTLTISAAGDIGTFGTDPNGYAKFPMGHGNIFQSLNDIQTNPFTNYINEGTQIRALNNTTLPATHYWYGISQPADIDASTQPTLQPEASRELIGQRYAYNFGLQGDRNAALSGSMATLYGYPLSQNPGRFAFWCLTWRTQFAGGGLLDMSGRALAIAGQGYGYTPGQWAT